MRTELYFRRYISYVIRNAKWVVAATLLVTLFFATQLRHLRLEVALDKSLPEDHPYVQTYRDIEKKFGQTELVIAAFTVAHDTVLRPDVMKMIGEITAEVQRLPYVTPGNVLSLTTSRTKDITGNSEGMNAKPFVEPGAARDVDPSELRRKIERNPVYQGVLVSKDFKTTAIIVDNKRNELSEYQKRESDLRKIIEPRLLPGVSYGLGGLPIQMSTIRHYSEKLKLYFGMAIVIVGFIHFLSFRTLQGLLLPLVTALISVVWATGLLGALHLNLQTATAPTPILLLAVAAGHAVQILKRYYEEFEHCRDNDKAIEEAIVKVGPVMGIAGLIAAVSFLSLLTFKLSNIRNFGLYSSAGILAALIAELTFTPALRSLMRAPARVTRQADLVTWLLEKLIVPLPRSRYARHFLVATAVLALLCVGAATRIKVDNVSKRHFPPQDPYLVADRWLNDALGGTEFISVVVQGGPDALKRPDVLRAIDGLQGLVGRDPIVGKTLSIVDFIKKMNQAMHGGDPRFNAVPDSQELVAQYLLLYSMSGSPGDFDNYVTNDYDAANVTLFLKTSSTAEGNALIARIEDFGRTKLPPGVQLRLSGSLPIITAINEVMIDGKIRNILQIFLTVVVLGSLVLRSLAGGLLISFPILMTVITNFGIMGLFGYHLDIATSLISALAVGVGVDYAIYFIFRLKEELALNGGNVEDGICAALRHGGEGILLVSLAISLGYFALCLSPFGFHRNLGLLVGVSMLVSSFSSITILPVMLWVLRPKFIVPREAPARESAPAPVFKAAASIALALGLGLASQPTHAAEGPSEKKGHEVMQQASKMAYAKFEHSHEKVTLELIRENGEKRLRKFTLISLLELAGGGRGRMMIFDYPPDIRGTSVFVKDDERNGNKVWVYLPALKKVRRLPQGGMSESFVGSDFSYGDITPPKPGDFTDHYVTEEPCPKEPTVRCHVVEHVATSQAVKDEWGVSTYKEWLRADNYVQVRMEINDAAGRPWKVEEAGDARLVDPKGKQYWHMWIEMENVQTHHRSRMNWDSIDVTKPVPKERITPEQLDRATDFTQ